MSGPQGDLTGGTGAIDMGAVPHIEDALMFLQRNGLTRESAERVLGKGLDQATVGELMGLPQRLVHERRGS